MCGRVEFLQGSYDSSLRGHYCVNQDLIVCIFTWSGPPYSVLVSYLWLQDKPAVCKVCDKRSEKERLLVCDNCLTCIHTFCLITPLPSMPTGGWQCPSCIAAVSTAECLHAFVCTSACVCVRLHACVMGIFGQGSELYERSIGFVFSATPII